MAVNLRTFRQGLGVLQFSDIAWSIGGASVSNKMRECVVKSSGRRAEITISDPCRGRKRCSKRYTISAKREETNARKGEATKIVRLLSTTNPAFVNSRSRRERVKRLICCRT